MKTCATCHDSKPFEEFNIRRSAADGRQPRCRDCCKAWYVANSVQHKVAVAGRNKRHRRDVQRWLAVYLREHPCLDCDQDDIRCLDFDHRPGEVKVMEIGKLIRYSASLAKIQLEIQKCDVRCANCHRRRTAERAGYWRQAVQEKAESEVRQASVERLRRLVPRPV